MSDLKIDLIDASFFRSTDRSEWDRFIADSANGGLLHSRRFLDYHGTRFQDLSLMFREPGNGALVGVMPVAASQEDAQATVSHAGSSFGGLVTRRPDPLSTAAMFVAASDCLMRAGFQTLSVLTHPTIFHRQPDDSDALFLTLAGHVSEVHLWSVIQVNNKTEVSKNRKTAVRSAQRAGLKIHESTLPEDYRRFYNTLERNLAERHARRPVHSFSEIMDLKERLGERARLFVASNAEEEMLAATWIWDYENGVWHSQYLCSTAEGKRWNAVEALILYCKELSAETGQRVYSIGRNTLSDGWSVNNGLLKFKKRLGCGLAAQRRIELELAYLRRVCLDWMEN